MDNHHFWWLNPSKSTISMAIYGTFTPCIGSWRSPIDFCPNPPHVSAQSDKNREPAQPGTPSISAKGSTNGQPITRFAKTDLDRVPPGRMIMSDLERNIWIILNIFLRCLRRFFCYSNGFSQDFLWTEFLWKMSHFYVPFALVTLVSHSFQGKGVVRRESSLNELDSESKGYSKWVIDDEEWSSQLLPLLVDWFLLPSGNLLQFAIENCHLVRTDLPIGNGDFPIFP